MERELRQLLQGADLGDVVASRAESRMAVHTIHTFPESTGTRGVKDGRASGAVQKILVRSFTKPA